EDVFDREYVFPTGPPGFVLACTVIAHRTWLPQAEGHLYGPRHGRYTRTKTIFVRTHILCTILKLIRVGQPVETPTAAGRQSPKPLLFVPPNFESNVFVDKKIPIHPFKNNIVMLQFVFVPG
ncbi:unnamed protein product, partial [Ectocarpus fasciculatus]